MNFYEVGIEKKRHQVLRWPDGFPEELKFSVKLGFWVWFCTTSALLVLVNLN